MKSFAKRILVIKNKYIISNIVLAIVGNYCEKLESEQVPEAEVRKFAKEKNAIFKFVSSVTGFGVKELFEEIGKKILILMCRN